MFPKTIFPFYVYPYIDKPDEIFKSLFELSWLKMTETHSEYFMSDKPRSYTYGSGNGIRTYSSNEFSREVNKIMIDLNQEFNLHYNVCFLNRYENEKEWLGWHADDSPEMDKKHPISVVTFGAEREIWWKPKDFKGEIPKDQRKILENGSLFTMLGGFQDYFYHKIPKHFSPCGPRISLTFRRFI